MGFSSPDAPSAVGNVFGRPGSDPARPDAAGVSTQPSLAQAAPPAAPPQMPAAPTPMSPPPQVSTAPVQQMPADPARQMPAPVSAPPPVSQTPIPTPQVSPQPFQSQGYDPFAQLFGANGGFGQQNQQLQQMVGALRGGNTLGI